MQIQETPFHHFANLGQHETGGMGQFGTRFDGCFGTAGGTGWMMRDAADIRVAWLPIQMIIETETTLEDMER